MKLKLYVAAVVAGIVLCWGVYRLTQASTSSLKTAPIASVVTKEGEEEREDGIRLAQEQEFNMTKDVSLGYVPKERLLKAYEQRINKNNFRPAGINALSWSERGPNTDAAGPFGNGRPGGGATSGRMRAIWVDLADATNKTVWVGGIDGGVWKTNDITAAPATWTLVNDFFSNLGIASICQDPSNTNTMYFGTGEKAFNADAVRGGGVWKSTDHGVNWTLLPSTTNFFNVSKIICDNAGNIYVATIGSGVGLQRSTDGGNTWTNILPTGLSTRVTEMKLSSTGRLHIVCGYYNTAAASAAYRYTDNPSTVSAATWTAPTTSFPAPQYNVELAVAGNTLYALYANASFQTPVIYKSTDGGDNWAPTAAAPPAASGNNDLSSGQGWYCLAIGVDPANDNNVIVGGFNCYKTTNGGASWSQVSVWVSGISAVTNYVHADQHIVTWNGNQVLIGTDGGLFYSSNAGTTFNDRNTGLRLKQFYSCAIHPSITDYFLAGAQDNGVHQFNSAGLSNSIEVTGGDGAFVHIDQDQPQYQFGSYVFNQYRRSADGGNTWASINFSSSIGQFINPTDYDNGNNIMYASGNAGQYIRWDNPQTGSTFTSVPVAAFAGGAVIGVTVSPVTANRVFFGTSNGKIVKVDNANSASHTDADITGSTMSASNVSCVNVGTTDNNLIACFSNYGAAHVWVSTTGGGAAGWTDISGNLPDIPVRWAIFYPENNTKAIIATEMGVYETASINGASTVWTPGTGFPIVRTDMIKYRKLDGTVAAATHGRGLWTSTIAITTPYIRFATPYATQPEATTGTSGCVGYKDYTVNMTIDAAPTGDATVTVNVAGGGTAIRGVDYDITTNGNFAAPSTTITFANGSIAPHPVTIRVYDDADIESTESFILNYIVTGATNALAAPSSPSYTLSITDNDVLPQVPGAITNYTIGTYNANLGSNNGGAFSSNRLKHRTQALYTAAELTAAGATAGNITAINLRVVTKNSTQPFKGFTINIASTAATNLSTGFIAPAFTQVYTGDYSSVVGNNTFTFGTGAGSSAFFTWNGTSNIVVQYCYDNEPGTADAAVDVMEGNLAPLGTGVTAATYANYTSGVATGCSLPAAFIADYRMNARFTLGLAGNPVETVLNASKTTYLGPNSDVYFYNSNGNVLARIKNLSSFDYGCTAVTVDRASNGATAFWNNTPANYLFNKTVHVVPANNNSSGQYQITLYYTVAEKAAWEAATGQVWANVQMVKVASQISDVTPATPAGGGTVLVATPTLGTYGTDYTMTYTFSNGFSGFGAGIPGVSPLPVTLLNFDGSLNGDNILLTWSTSSEQNSDYFDVQKSSDGNNFYSIGKVKAAGNSSRILKYTLKDGQVNELNYYRLQTVDLDRKSLASKTILIKNPGVVQKMWVVNNPFSSYIDIRFAKMPRDNAKVELMDMKGAVVYSRQTGGATAIRLDFAGVHLSTGTYLLRTLLDGKVYTSKVVKQ